MKKEIFGKRFLAVKLPNPLVVTFCYFTRAGRAPTLRPSENFSFGDVFLRRGRVTDIKENNFHVVMGWSRENFMFVIIHPIISVGPKILVRAAFIILQEKKEKEPAHTHDYYIVYW